MSSFPSIVTRIRRLLRASRHQAAGSWTQASRFYRGVRYLFSLLIWSRIAGGRRNLRSIELPRQLLAKKNVHVPPPRLAVSGGSDSEAFSSGFAEIYAVLFANLQKPGILSRFHHALPGPAFRGIYLWDSAFISQIWKCWEPEMAAEVLQAVIELREGDRLQHVVSEFAQSRYTQPPLIAWSAVAAGEWMSAERRKHFFAAIEVPLRRYHQWLCEHRQLPNGLFFWDHPYESGVENAPRFGSRDEKQYRETRRTAAPDLSAYLVLQLEALATIADTLGRARDAADLRRKADSLRARIETELWHEDDGLYYDREIDSGTFIRSPSIASLMPLWAGVPSAERAHRLCEAATATDSFGTLIPLPSVPRSDPTFEKDMWRGPVWINTAYGAVQGLLHYGFDDAAGEMAFRLCAGVYQVFLGERQVYEFYDPDAIHTRDLHRKRGNRWKAFTLGTGPQKDFVGWTGLVNTLVIEVLFGLCFTGRRLTLRPRFPEAAAETSFCLEIPGRSLQITLTRTSFGEHHGDLRHGLQAESFRIASGSEAAFFLNRPDGSPCATAT